ncbi:hypothetical protein [Portibacter lacus]|uniref:Uncharacterized protein n=1 Tax=Portibacter lacus TaxID=1099794 RepID=A0AA37WD39_9BACT|nr:hypothetical protein [Portibacter lacus]GLR16498.1 hypothetical protein GCM10007940_11130 [Portibacter lacus]
MKIRILSLLALCVTVLFSCTKEEANSTYDAPSVSAPSSVMNVQSGATGLSVTFNTSVDADLTATYQATGNGVTIANPTGDVSGNTVTINFDAGNTSGAASITLVVTDSENQDDEATAVINVGAEVTEILLTTNVTEDVTWTADRTYILGGRISVESGATLTIEPGTVIKGQAGTGANATALLIARGGKLMAEGSADLPIVFTSIADELTGEDIANGNVASPNLDPDINGLWGGVIVLGNAPISASNDNGDVSEVQIEGVPTSDPNGLYGGNDPEDNSGVIKYVSIRHGGSNIGSGNEINGLTLGGVGSGTVVDNIEIVANQDDGIEWFGGTVNVTNVAVWNVGDDGIDTDQSWNGTLDNFVVVTPTGHCFELDGPEGSAKAGHTIQNGSILASSDDRVSEDLINVDENSIVSLKNLYFKNVVEGQMINRVTAEGVTFEGIEINVAAENLANHVNGEVPAGVTIGSATKADISVLSWTWTSKSGVLAEL